MYCQGVDFKCHGTAAVSGLTYEKIISRREIDDSDKKPDYNDNLRHKELILEIYDCSDKNATADNVEKMPLRPQKKIKK